VYAFDGTTYTGYNKTTDAAGYVTFTLPLGDYRFRADKNGTHFWSGETSHCTLPGCTTAMVTTTIPVIVTVADTGGTPESGLKVYAFDGTTYTGYNKTTDGSGQATFTLPEGDYRFRADKSGTQFWSSDSNHCTLPGCTTAAVTTTIPVVVTVANTLGSPEVGLKVYAFDGTAYTGYNKTTSADGQAVFTLPQGNYRFRADKDGTQFWSGETNHCALPGCTKTTITLPAPAAIVRTITYTYDPLGRLTDADYSTGEFYAYAYDEVGNRTAYTVTLESTTVTTYTYDAANRLTAVGDVAYTWDERGNLMSDGTFTYTYNGAGRLVRAESVTNTLAYTYTAGGLRVAQSVDGDASTFAWDWASGLPEMLSEGDDLYLVGHETLGKWDGDDWAYYLPDALGSVRQETDETGTVTDTREWTPYGVEVGGTQAGLGYAGEWGDAALGMTYLRARWYDSQTGRFTRADPWKGVLDRDGVYNAYAYANQNPTRFRDPSGHISEGEKIFIRTVYDWYIKDTTERLNVRSLTNLSDNGFATMIAARIIVEDASIFAEDQPKGTGRQMATLPVSILKPHLRDELEKKAFGGEISWGPANMRLDFVTANLQWWEQHYSDYDLELEDVHTHYYSARERGAFLRWLLGDEGVQLTWELQTAEGTADQMALAILRSSWRARQYFKTQSSCRYEPPLSAYRIAIGIIHFRESDVTLYEPSSWTSKGFQWNWVEAMDDTAEVLGLKLTRGDDVHYYDYFPYTLQEKKMLDTIP
jgi:RHS repeat-associated protein